MSEPLIRRRTLPDSLRYLADKLDGPLTDGERAGVALTLNSLADEAETERNAHAHELAERIREAGAYWGERAATGKAYRAAADLIDPQQSAGPVRPGEETTP